MPWLTQAVPVAEQARRKADRLYEEGQDAAGPHPGWTVPAIAREHDRVRQAVIGANGYFEAADLANDLSASIAEAFEPFRDTPMTTLPALAWKTRLSLMLFDDGEDVLADLAALAGWGPEAA